MKWIHGYIRGGKERCEMSLTYVSMLHQNESVKSYKYIH